MSASNVTERMYLMLKRPLVTEKTARALENNCVTFEVLPCATKPEIKAAVEAIYNVKVANVNTMNCNGKMKRFKGTSARRSDTKKAMVTLQAGHTIDFSAGL